MMEKVNVFKHKLDLLRSPNHNSILIARHFFENERRALGSGDIQEAAEANCSANFYLLRAYAKKFSSNAYEERRAAIQAALHTYEQRYHTARRLSAERAERKRQLASQQFTLDVSECEVNLLEISRQEIMYLLMLANCYADYHPDNKDTAGLISAAIEYRKENGLW